MIFLWKINELAWLFCEKPAKFLFLVEISFVDGTPKPGKSRRAELVYRRRSLSFDHDLLLIFYPPFSTLFSYLVIMTSFRSR